MKSENSMHTNITSCLNHKCLVSLVGASLCVFIACGDDAKSGEADANDTPVIDAGDGCSVRLAPGNDDQTAVQTALIETATGDTVCFEAGTYSFTGELSLSTSGVTLLGIGDTREDVILDFSNQSSGGNGIAVTGDNFVIEQLTVQDPPGDGIRVTDATGVTMRNIKVEWTNGPDQNNGAYGLYPVGCTDVLIEDCVVSGAADAGVYVGQSTNIIVRRNEAFGNVAGIEVENSTAAEVYENNAHDNTGGILVFALPDLPKKDCQQVLVRDNQIVNNNQPNFADPSSIVANVPVGTGILILAADKVEVHSNTITGNDSVGVISASYLLVELLTGASTSDTEFDKYSETNWIHGNTMSGNGTVPEGLTAILGVNPVEDIVFGGFVDPAKDNSDNSLSFCVSDIGSATFRMADFPNNQDSPVLDPTDYTCTHTPLPSIEI
tara:strand:- start:58 stop:1368 length:1311 start_codon:yes stop_codon:yes gene_type:complete